MTQRLIRIGAAIAAIAAIASLTACGAGTGSPSSGSAKGSSPVRSPLPAARKFLGVTPDVIYGNQKAIALAKGVSNGRGYRDIISDMPYSALLSHFNGAVIGDLHVVIIFTGEVKQAVRVTNIQITSIKAARSAFSGTYLPIAHQGAQEAYEFTADMNQAVPRLTRTKSGQAFPDFNIRLAAGEQSTVGINFTASRGSFKWLLTVTYLVGTNVYRMVVRAPGGHPFAVTAPVGQYSVAYVNSGFSGPQLKSK